MGDRVTDAGHDIRPRALRVLFLNRSYYPDVEATGQLLTELCSDLARTDDVTVVAGRPNFVAGEQERGGLVREERHCGVRILRVRNSRFRKVSMFGRAVGLATYLVLAIWAAFRSRRPDVIVVETDPPMLGAVGGLLKWWHRCPLVFYLQDLFPEVGLALGKFRPGPLTWLLRAMTQVGLRHADRVVVLGEDMRQRVLRRGIDPAKVTIVPNWADASAVRPRGGQNSLREAWGVGDRFAVMYSGNLGLSQNLEPVLVCARELRDEPVVFLFIGEGAAKQGLMAQAAAWGLENVRFLPYQPKERLGESLTAADLHLVPLRRGLAGCIVPSKLYGILAAGVPYVAAVDAESEVACITRQGDCGLLVEPDSAPPLVEAVRWALAHRDELRQMGRRGRALAEAHFDRPASVAKFRQVLRDLGSARNNGSGRNGFATKKDAIYELSAR
jgi:glycosyltransferase involved in cell wall biosynthesis